MSNRYEHNSYRSDADDREHERRYSRDRSDYDERPHVQRTREYRSREQLPRDRYDAGRQRYERSASERRAYEQRSARDDYGQRQQQRSSTYRSREDHADYASQRSPYSRYHADGRDPQSPRSSRQHADFEQRYAARNQQRPADRNRSDYSQPRQAGQGRYAQAGRPAQADRHTVMLEPRVMSNDSRLQDGSKRRPQPFPTLGQPQRQASRLPFVAGIAVIAVIAAIVVFVLHPFNSKITVNGTEQTVAKDATISTLLEAGYASPKAGNLLAVDGSVFTEGGGDAFAATINGEATNDPQTAVPDGAQVEIKDGADVTETFKTSEEAIKHGVASSSTSAESYWAGSLHVYSKGSDGTKTVKTGDVSGKKVEEITKPAVDSGYSNYTANTNGDKKVALTFDDGPWPDTTKELLDIFESNNAKCTFFTIGNQVATYADQVKRANELGCQVCTHTWDHAAGSGEGVNLTFMSEEEQINEIKKGYKAIKDVIGSEPDHVMRAPGGNYFGDLITTLAPYVDAEIGWDVDTEDWRTPGADKIYERIMTVKPGQVVLMHDGGGNRKQTVEAVAKAVPELMAQGYELVTVNDLLAYGTPETKSDEKAS